jgi:hypothetical protein
MDPFFPRECLPQKRWITPGHCRITGLLVEINGRKAGRIRMGGKKLALSLEQAWAGEEEAVDRIV